MRRNQFGSIRKLASGRFQVRITNAQGDRIAARSIDGKPLTFESEKIARTYLLHLQSDFMRGVDPYASNPRSSETLKVRLDKYLDPLSGARLTSKPLRSSTAANYRRLADGSKSSNRIGQSLAALKRLRQLWQISKSGYGLKTMGIDG